ncbi:MAG: ROK family protein [Candidatus Nanopelagicales bacterium]
MTTVPTTWPHDVLTLGIDIGGTGLKAAIVDSQGVMVSERHKIPTPYPCPPPHLIDSLRQLTDPLEGYQRVSVGFPGLVRHGVVLEVPAFSRREYGGPPDAALVADWSGFPLADALAHAFALPTIVVNDADMQGAAVVEGHGVEFVMTLGTGVGTALFNDGTLLPHFDLSHGPFRKGMTFDIALGEARRQEIGTKRWRPQVHKAIGCFHDMLFYDRIYVGGGNARRLDPVDVGPKGVIIPNTSGILGGVRIWQMTGQQAS